MTDSGHDTKLGTATEHDDEAALEELRRLSAKFVPVESPPETVDEEEDLIDIAERLAGQHDTMDQGVGRVLFRLRLLYTYCYSLLGLSVYTVVDFYRQSDYSGDLSVGFRVGFGSFIVTMWVLINIVFRTHGGWAARLNASRLFFASVCLVVITFLPGRWIPLLIFFLIAAYFYLRKENRSRIILGLTILFIVSIATFVSPWLTDPVYHAFFAAMACGLGAAIVLRKVSTLRSGGGVLDAGKFNTWWEYEEARQNLNELDVILESENRYAPSRVTTLFSRSPWTHSGMIVRNPSDQVKALYGVKTQTQLMQELTRQINLETTSEEEQLARNKAISRLELELNEELYVFEAVRPVVALTPLCTWMAAKEANMPYKVIVCRRLKMYEGRAKVILDRAGLEELMLEVNGLPFALQAKSMLKANYQFNRERFTDSIFCSELVAEAYQRVGLLSEKRLSSNFTPRDFSSSVETKLLVDARFCDEVRIRAAPPDTADG